MTGPELVPVEVNSPEWLEARRHGVSASEIAGLLGIAPDTWTSPFNLFWRKKAGIGDEPDNDRMQFGHDFEDVILRRFAREHPELDVQPGGLYRRAERPWQMATPDGIAYSAGAPVAVVQAKTAGNRHGWGDVGTDEIPPYYLAQVRWEMDVMAVDVAYVPVLFGVHDYREYVVHQDRDDVDLMVKEARAFLDRVEADDPPDVDHRAATLRTLKQLHPDLEDEERELEPDWVAVWLQAAVDMDDANARRKEAEAHIRQQLGASAYGTVNGERVVTRSKYTVKEQIRKAYDADRINVKRQKES